MHDVDGVLWCRDASYGVAARAFGMRLGDARIVANELRMLADAIDAWPTTRIIRMIADERVLRARDVEDGS